MSKSSWVIFSVIIFGFISPSLALELGVADADEFEPRIGQAQIPHYSSRKLFDTNAVIGSDEFPTGKWNADVVVAIEDKSDEGLVTVVNFNLETLGWGTKTGEDRAGGWLPIKVSARVNSDLDGSVESMTEFASIALQGGLNAGSFSNSRVKWYEFGKLLEARIVGNDDEELKYERALILNAVSTATDFLVAEGRILRTDLDIKIFVGFGLDLGVGKADESEADWKAYNLYKACMGVQLDAQRAEVVGEYCFSQFDAGSESLLDDSRIHDLTLSSRLRGSRISLEGYGQVTEFDDAAEQQEKYGVRARVRFGRTR